MRRFREPIYEQVALLLEAYWRPGLSSTEKTEILRTVIDAIHTNVGATLLRELHRTRAYHARSGELGPNELLRSDDVLALVRQQTGLASEPQQPVERPTRSRFERRTRR